MSRSTETERNLPAGEPVSPANHPWRSAEVAARQSELKAAILTAIAEHVRAHGRRQWDLIRERPEFAPLIGREAGVNGKRRFWRWVNAVCEPPPADRTRPHEAREVTADALRSATERARLAAERNLPAAPSPSYLMRAGADASKNLDFLAAVHLIWADAERLREHAMRIDQTAPDGMAISDGKLFDASIRRRVEVMESALRVMRRSGTWNISSVSTKASPASSWRNWHAFPRSRSASSRSLPS
jgi:hypothetical protein